MILGSAGQPHSMPRGGGFAAHPTILKLLEEEPGILPLAIQVAEIERAWAEGEVAFLEAELNGGWENWSGVFPWEGAKDPDTTDCPWWLAGSEYVFCLAAAWRKHSGRTIAGIDVELLLPKQIEDFADWVYRCKVRLHDMMKGRNSTEQHILVGHAPRFINIACLYCLAKFAEFDRDECRTRAGELAATLSDLNSSRSINDSGVLPATDASEQPTSANDAGKLSEQAPVPNETGTEKTVSPPAPKRERNAWARSRSPEAEQLYASVRQMKKDGLTQLEMCNRLDAQKLRPPELVGWRHLTWRAAFRHPKYDTRVEKWLSKAVRVTP